MYQNKSDQVREYKEFDTVGPYKIIKQLKGGAFGKLFRVENQNDKKLYAMKISTLKTRAKLKNEYGLCQTWSQTMKYFKINEEDEKQTICMLPKVYFYAETKEKDECVVVMDLMKHNLSEAKINDIKKVGRLMIRGLEKFHTMGWIHNDLKPENMMKDYKDKYFLIDFGLSMKFMKSSEKHIDENLRLSGFVGTMKYASTRIHERKFPTRRDDLESLIYVLLALKYGGLPWQIQTKAMTTEQGRNDLEKNVYNCKMKFSSWFNSKDDECYVKCWNYIRNLEFRTLPDYDYLIRLLL